MSKKIFTSFDFQGGAKVTGLPTPVSASDAVPLSYLEGQLEGLSWKEAVIAASTSNVNISAPGTTLDGVALTQGDRVLLKSQTSAPTNGIYVFVASDEAMVRADDASTFAELEAAVVTVEEGDTNAGTTWRQTAVNGAISVDDLLFAPFGVVTPNSSTTVAGKVELATQTEVNEGTSTGGTGAPLVVTPDKLAAWPDKAKRYATTIGDGVATSIAVTHGLSTRDVVVSVYDAATYDEVFAEVVHTSTSQVTLSFSEAPAASAYRVVVVG